MINHCRGQVSCSATRRKGGGNSGCGAVRTVASFSRRAGVRISCVRFFWQAQQAVTPGVGGGESVWGAVACRCAALPRGARLSRRRLIGSGAQRSARILVVAQSAVCICLLGGSWLGRAKKGKGTEKVKGETEMGKGKGGGKERETKGKREGRERKGKERKAKERKGKERKGKGREGKERKGKERKGKERESKDSLVLFCLVWFCFVKVLSSHVLAVAHIHA